MAVDLNSHLFCLKFEYNFVGRFARIERISIVSQGIQLGNGRKPTNYPCM